ARDAAAARKRSLSARKNGRPLKILAPPHPRLIAPRSRRIVSSQEQTRIDRRSGIGLSKLRSKTWPLRRGQICSYIAFRRPIWLRSGMPAKKHSLIQKQHRRPLDLPPAFRPVRLREAGDAFAHACRNAITLGAGTLVFVGRFGIAEFAVILEPEEPLRVARLTVYAGMAALCDA